MNDQEQLEQMMLRLLEQMEAKKKAEEEAAAAVKMESIKGTSLKVAGHFGSELVKGLALGAGLALTLF